MEERKENKLTEMSVESDANKDVKSIFESLGYTDPKQFERLLKFLEKGFFNDLDPTITEPNKIEPQKKYPLKRIIPNGYKKFNDDWALSSTGDMFNIEGGYDIFDYRLDDDFLILHLMGKYWFDANTFIPAYFEACNRAGIKEVKIRTYY